MSLNPHRVTLNMADSGENDDMHNSSGNGSEKEKKLEKKSDSSFHDSGNSNIKGDNNIASHKRPKSRSRRKKSDLASFESTSTSEINHEEEIASEKKKKSKRKNKPSLSTSFHNRLGTSLVAGAEFSFNEEVIDVEEEMELNRRKEIDRKKMKKKKNKHDGIDPRLFPSYKAKTDEFNDEDEESSMIDFRKSSLDIRKSSLNIRSSRNLIGSDLSNRQRVSVVQGRKIVQLSVIVPPAEMKDGNKKRNTINFSKILADSQREGVVRGIRPCEDTTSFSSPIRLLEIENGGAILVRGAGDMKHRKRTTMSVAAVKQTMATKDFSAEMLGVGARGVATVLSPGRVRDFDVAEPEQGISARKDILRGHLTWSMDAVNALNLGRQIQSSIPFLSGYESFLLGRVVEVLLECVVSLKGVISDSNVSRKVMSQVEIQKMTELNEILGFAFKNHNVSRVIIESVDRRWDFSLHWFQKVCKCRWYDAWGQFPIPGITKFPGTENFPIPGDWFNKYWVPDTDKIVAQNLSAECNGFEEMNRNQFGTYIGRSKTNNLRVTNRLPVDESIVHTFVVSPLSTMINNGAVHVLQQMSKHWLRILEHPLGNFAHHRLEQIDPFETMRFHMPIVCVVLASLRGRNLWDARVLGSFIRKCQILTISGTANECLNLAKEMQVNIVPNLCAGVLATERPLSRWLEAIQESCHAIEEGAKEIYKEVSGVEIGLQFGHDLVTQVSWKIPSDKELKKAILLYLQGDYPGAIIHERNIRRAFFSTTPRDKQTLKELVKLSLQKSKPAMVLLESLKNLLKRDIRREFLNDAMRELSIGERVFENDLIIDDWYWFNEENDKKSVYIFKEEEMEYNEHLVSRFVHADTGLDRIVYSYDLEATECRRYIPVAESIIRAQRCYMNIELDYCHKFKYDAFAEFAFLRTALNRLAVVSQIFCDELDNARLNILQEVKAMNQFKVEAGDLEPGNTYYIYNSLYDIYAPFVCKKKFSPSDPEWPKLQKVEMVKVLPQSTIVLGSGITGLMTAIHCTESVLTSGGDIKLYEPSDANAKEGSVFERAQIVRLDPRWVAMLRYHLGTAFEDTFIPTSTELQAHLGNNLVVQGFVEITIKDLECILHAELTRLWSREIIQVYTGLNVFYDYALNSLVKLGEHLEVGDKILRRVNPMGKPCKELHRWTVADVQNAETLDIGDLCIGEEYDVYVKQENSVSLFKLIDVDFFTRTYKFESLKKKTKNIEATPYDLPSVYPKGSKRHYKTLSMKCEIKGESESSYYDCLSQTLEGTKFMIDIGHNHVVQCIGKPDASPYHFQVTSSEPYGFCCISRVNRSMESRGILDGFNSATAHNTRIIGDSIKMVRQTFIAELMVELIDTKNWQLHFIKLIEDSEFSSLNDKDPIVTKLAEAVVWHKDHSSDFRRQNLQMKMSETTDNFYLGMELTREYDKWKNETVDHLLSPVKGVSKDKKQNMEELKEILRHNIDLLWFEACLEVLRHSGVYNTDQKIEIARMPLINSHVEETLKHLSVGDSFRVVGKMNRKFEILLKKKEGILKKEEGIFARSADGVVQKFDQTTEVFREGYLSRSINGDTESKVAVATFPVSHHVNHRSICLNNETKGYVFASIGDEQSASHFMHYSALSGGAINVVQFNQFLRSAIDGNSLTDRLHLYSKETNWSNGEVIQRGIMTSFGQDSFLRPGFSLKQGLKYICSQVIGGKQNLDNILSRDLRTKFAASMIPRGMELNNKFLNTLKEDTNLIIFHLFLERAMNDEAITWSDGLKNSLETRRDDILSLDTNIHRTFWDQFFEGLTTSLDDASQKRLHDVHGEVAKQVVQFVLEVIDFAKEDHIFDRRSSQELWNQPKPVDSIVDDFAADGRTLPNFLAQSTVLCAASVALVLYASRRDNLEVKYLLEICSMFISVINIFLCVGNLLHSVKYKTRNEQARAIFLDKHLLDLKKAVYGAMNTEDRKAQFDDDPFLEDLEKKKKFFVEGVEYYGLEDPDEFIYDYRRLLEKSDEPAAFKHFQKLLVTKYIPNVYQINSYVQESLVEVYKACDEIHTLLTQNGSRISREERKSRKNIPYLFNRVVKFGPSLQKSLDSSLMNSEIFLALRYSWSFVSWSSSTRESVISTIENETYGIIKEVKIVSKAHKGTILKHQIRDLEYLYRATLETDKGAVVFLSTSLVFMASCFFVISRIVALIYGTYSVLTVIGFWFQLTSIVGAFLSSFFLVRHLCHSLRLWVKLGVKISDQKLDKSTRKGLRKIKGYIFMKLLLTALRVCTVLFAAVALLWCVAANTIPGKIPTFDLLGESFPLYIALVAFCLVIVTTILFVLVEYTIGYNLPPKLGEVLCEAFREEIESMYKALSISENKFDSKQSKERITWEYVAREFLHKYRFDAIFGPDRFGSILQYLQCGMEKREEMDDGGDII